MSRPSAPTPAVSASKLRRDPDRIRRSWTAFRQTSTYPDIPVFWREASNSRPVPQDSGRWNVTGGEYAQYLSLSEPGAWAEFIRARELVSAQKALGTHRRMWIARIHETEIADLSTRDKAAACGIDPVMLVGPHGPCQALALELQANGYRGVLSPCAALDRATNLTLWGPRIDDHLEPLDRFSQFAPNRGIIEVKLLRAASSTPGDLIDSARLSGSPPDTYLWE